MRETRLIRWLGYACLLVLAGIALGLDARLGRPIWIDEFLHFAFAGFPDTASAWSAIAKSIGSINFNQTGLYMIVDFWLLKLFGASAFILRLPSLLSAAFLLLGAVIFMRNRGYSSLWQVVVIVGMFAADPLMQYTGEARPYMPLAAAAVGILAFYSAPPERRGRGTMVLGYAAALLGAAFHPYFPAYWAVALLFSYGVWVAEDRAALSVASALRFANPWLIAAGVAIYAAVAELSWLPRRVPLNFDPFQWIPRDYFWLHFWDLEHFAFLRDPNDLREWTTRWSVPLAMLITAALGLLLPRRFGSRLRPFVAPLVLLVLAVGLSLLVSWLSIRSHYWILGRQWIGSFPLVVIAVVWFFAEAGRQLSLLTRFAGPLLALAALWCFSSSIERFLPGRVAEMTAPASHQSDPPADQLPTDNTGWVALANENIAQGGPVWPVFRSFYDDK